MKEKKKNNIDINFFKEMNYEIAGEHGILDNEDMKNNKELGGKTKTNKSELKKK
ncbi:hypothetical protein [Tissierella sp. Yu-01]|uniref:hypothetical protein n=1 Tax=Tissierella sp. Yu-01 TaxID=3035694 RepID=UPI00240E1513|nr:hypothetical protein [Tissierella sp. Yu-01]WFA10132.1 hypothetical protein P3962_06165 [Tissierella sp. Yu-01]